VVDGLQQVYAGFNLPHIEDVGVHGTPDDCVRGVRDVISAGAELVLFTPFFDDDGRQMERRRQTSSAESESTRCRCVT
jgi:alkanesulfonate monooxygenase SsuD/methylene tetrahydromethanopterin reductase-like flavin-dependent oxidoreductase (luciferase family)